MAGSGTSGWRSGGRGSRCGSGWPGRLGWGLPRRWPVRWSRCTARTRRRCIWRSARGSRTRRRRWRRPSGRCTRTGPWCGCTACGTPCSCSRRSLTAVVHASTGLAVAARERAALLKDMAKAGAPDAAWLKEVEESALAALARRGAGDGGRARRGRTAAAGAVRVRGREELRGRPHRRDPAAEGAGGGGQGGPRAAARAPGRPASSAGRSPPSTPNCRVARGPGGAAAALARRVRAGHRGRPEVVDGLAGDGRPPGADGDRGAGGDAGRGHGVRRRRTTSDAGAGPAEPWAALLPGLDPTAMGWQQRDWYLAPELRPRPVRLQRQRGADGVVERPGGGRVGPSGPTARSSGGSWTTRVWAARRRRRSRRRRSGCGAWVGATRVTPRFRTPVEKELVK